MAEVYYVAIPHEKKLYYLGTLHSAKSTFPLLMEEVGSGVAFVLFGEDTHAFLDDQYKDNDAFEEIEYDFISSDKDVLSEKVSYSREEFLKILWEYGGKEVDYVPHTTRRSEEG